MRHLFYLLLLSMAFWGCEKVPTTEPGQPFDHFVGDFETGDLSGFHFLLPDSAVNAQVVTQPVRKGTFVLKNTLRPQDYAFNGYRAELSIYNCAKFETEVYYGFSFMIDSMYSDSAYNLICQWQDLPYYIQGENWEPDPNLRGYSPPLALVYVDGTLELKMNENPRSNQHTFRVGDAIPVQKGAWIDVVARIFWSDDKNAYMEILVNGNFLTPFNGTDHKFYGRNLYNRAGNYFKFGQYRGKDQPSQTNLVYFDEVKIGTSYGEVTP